MWRDFVALSKEDPIKMLRVSSIGICSKAVSKNPVLYRHITMQMSFELNKEIKQSWGFQAVIIPEKWLQIEFVQNKNSTHKNLGIRI